MSPQQTEVEAVLSVENIGGISETEVAFYPGVTILSGENATNRTSLLQAIMAALGSDNVSLKGNTDEASVEMDLHGETYTRRLSRQNTAIQTSGDPYLDDPTLADLFASLIESNEARQSVANSDDLREIIMRPVDMEEIQRDIDNLTQQRREIENELEELESLKNRLPKLEERKSKLEEEIEEKKARLEAKEEELEERDADIQESREEREDLEVKLSDLRSRRTELGDVRYEIETERESLESARGEKREVEQELDEFPDAPMGEIEELESRIHRLRQQRNNIESWISDIQNIIQFNEKMLEGSSDDFLGTLSQSNETVADELLPDEEVACWTCGTKVNRGQVEGTVEQLRELSQDKLSEVNDIDDQLNELNEKIQALREKQDHRERLNQRKNMLEDDISHGEETIDQLTDRRETLQEEVKMLETEIEEMEDETYEDILELHKEANQLEYELGRLEGNLEDLDGEIEDIEERLDQEIKTKNRLEKTNTEIEELRTRIERIEEEAIEEFNDHMESVLELLEYENLERIWLERVEKEAREGRRKVTKSEFELHVIRESEGGVMYEDTVDHLSQSEREVMGLVFALAGYLVHDVYETVPFMLLDSLESIDANRIATLIEYIEKYCEYLVVALLPEDAEALGSHHDRITNI